MLLNAHPAIHAPPPLHLGVDVWQLVHHFGNLEQDDNWAALVDATLAIASVPSRLGISLTRAELLALPERSFIALYRHIYEADRRAAGKRQLFLKENHVDRYFEFLVQAFPEAKFLWLVRDPRDFALSCLRMRRYRPYYGSFPEAVATWERLQRDFILTSQRMAPGQVFFLRYEDLTRETEASLRAVCDFLDEDYDPAMLAFHESNTSRELAQEKPHFWGNLSKPVMRDNVGKYKSGLNRLQLLYAEERLRDIMPAFGYEADTSPPGSIGIWATALYEISARGLERLLDAWDRIRDPEAREPMELPAHLRRPEVGIAPPPESGSPRG